jgi:RHS repeat-associated protein
MQGITGATASYQYDPNGNLIQKVENGETWTYEWNAENQLTRVTKDTVEVATFKYDPLGRRIEKTTAPGTTTFIYDGGDVVRKTSPGDQRHYVHGPGGDEVLSEEISGGARTFYHADALGSVVAGSDNSGAQVFARSYETWGGLSAGSITSEYGYIGREWDAETELYYTRARYYAPDTGRFLSEDPIGTPTAGLYVYAANNPALLVDLNGLQATSTAGGGSCKQTCATPLPPAPPLPPGEDINKNIDRCDQPFTQLDPWWYRDQVKNKAPWDYKQKGPQYQAGGNYNYGATCKAYGFRERFCLREAGRAQKEAGTSKPEWGEPGSRWNPGGGTGFFGDDPADAFWIEKGFEYFDAWKEQNSCGCAP